MPPQETTDLQALKAQQKKIEASGSLHWFHWFIIVASLLLTLTAWYIAKTQHENQIAAQYEREADRVVQLVTERMSKYEDILSSGAAFVRAKGTYTTSDMWKQYSDLLNIEEKYPGINGIGVIHTITPEQREPYEAYMRQERPDFKIFPVHDNPDLLPIVFIEPVSTNAAAVGLDVAHESNRYMAAKIARNTGLPQITGPIILVQDAEKTPGFLFYYPYYKRRADDEHNVKYEGNLAGLVYAPFIFHKLMNGRLETDQRHVGLKIIDDGHILFNENTAETPNFDAKPLFSTITEMDMYGRKWTIEIQSDISFRRANKNNKPWIILLGGIVIDTLLLTVFMMLARANRRAVTFASNLAETHQSNSLQLSNIIENAVEGIMQNDTNGIILTYNKACEDIFGYTAEEAIGQNIRFIVPVPKPLKDKLDKKIRENTAKHKDGHRFPIEFSTSVLNLRGETVYSSIIRDISDRKEAEITIRKTMEELKLSNDDLEKFAYIASHDLKSPLRAIDNLSAWLAEDLEHQIDEVNQTRLSKLRGRVTRMERLLDDLLQYSRAANKSYPVDKVSVDKIITDISNTLNVPENFEIIRSPELSDIQVSRMPLEQVFHNLISNAIKHHDETNGTVKVTGKKNKDDYEFTVTDDGPGIEPDYHKRIFEMFQTLRRRDEVEASGIGLAVVKKIIHRYGGTIRVDSQMGKGSAFTFTWPIIAPDSKVADSKSDAA